VNNLEEVVPSTTHQFITNTPMTTNPMAYCILVVKSFCIHNKMGKWWERTEEILLA